MIKVKHIIEIGKKKIELSEDECRALYFKLHEIYGEKQTPTIYPLEMGKPIETKPYEYPWEHPVISWSTNNY